MTCEEEKERQNGGTGVLTTAERLVNKGKMQNNKAQGDEKLCKKERKEMGIIGNKGYSCQQK